MDLSKIVKNIQDKSGTSITAKNRKYIKNHLVDGNYVLNHFDLHIKSLKQHGINQLKNGNLTYDESRALDNGIKANRNVKKLFHVVARDYNDASNLMMDDHDFHEYYGKWKISKDDYDSNHYVNRINNDLKKNNLLDKHGNLDTFSASERNSSKYYTLDNPHPVDLDKVIERDGKLGISQTITKKVRQLNSKPKKITSFTQALKELGIKDPSKNKLKQNSNRKNTKHFNTRPIKKDKLNRNHGRNRNINRGPSLD